MFTALLLGLAWSAPPAWQWPAGSARTYAIETYVRLPEVLRLRAPTGDEDAAIADVQQFQVDMVTSCEAGLSDPRGWTLVCTVRDLGLVAKTKPGDDTDIGPVLAAIDQRLTGALLTVAQDRSGRVVGLALADTTKKERKVAPQACNAMLWVLERGLLGLDLALPDDGNPSWGEPSSGLLSYVPAAQSHGVTRIFGHATPTGALLDITTLGRGVVQVEALSSRAESGPPGGLSVSLALQGSARFDTAEGALLSQDWVVLGRATPQALSNQMLGDPTYAWAGSLRRTAPGEKVDVGATGPWTEAFVPGPVYDALTAARPALEGILDGSTPLLPPPAQ